MSEAGYLAEGASYLRPTRSDGVWASAGAHALRQALAQRSPRGVMELLNGMGANGMVQVLLEAGFEVDGQVAHKGPAAVYGSVKRDLETALRNGVDGHGLRSLAVAPSRRAAASGTALNAVSAGPSRRAPRSAVDVIQDVLQSPSVKVLPLGQARVSERASLQMVAAQALQKGVLGFAFDGLPGKFVVPAPMKEVAALHKAATAAVAVESAHAALVAWAGGAKVVGLSEWVPDSTQRLLHGPVSKGAAEVVISSISSGSIARHAEAIGQHGIASLLAARGLDLESQTVQEQAAEHGLRLRSPDRDRGNYYGAVMAQDHRASLVRINPREAIELPFSQTPGWKPKLGEQVRVVFKAGAVSVSAKSMEREGAAR